MSENSVMLNRHIAFELYRQAPADGLEYTYRGNVNSDVVENILSLAETNFGDMKEQLLVRKRVYFIMVESLQNITRHQENYVERDVDSHGLFVIRRGKFGYYITCANLVKTEHCENLKNKIDFINSKNSEELKNYSRSVLSNGQYSNKGGAGLGLIEISRKAGSKIKYKFVPEKNGYSRFYQHIDILFNKKEIDNPDAIDEISQFSLDKLIKLHEGLQKYHIVLNYSGILNQVNLINLMNILSRQINVSKALKTKVYCIMIELLQNILGHADRINGEEETNCYGMFFIRQDRDHLILSAANHILNSKVGQMKDLIEGLNSIDKDERGKLSHDPKLKASGLIKIMNKSRHQVEYNFSKIDNNYSLFSVSIFLDKESNADIVL
ncbi:MAG: SiaB family protein kinase [Bacteroidales bacterium]|nr:SiaB family protein kinase [Bacteroidales bacterium]